MKGKILASCVLLVVLVSSVFAGFTVTYTELLNSLPLQRYAGNPIIAVPYTNLPWLYSQAFDPVVMDDPNDFSKLIMYMSGMYAPVNAGEMSVGIFTASKSSPFTWTPYTSQPVLRGGNPPYTDTNGYLQSRTGWDWGPTLIPGARLGGVVRYNGVTYMCYGGGSVYRMAPGLATSTDGYSFTKYGTAPMFPRNSKLYGPADSSGLYEISIEDPCLFRDDDGTWYIFYSYIGGTNQNYTNGAGGVSKVLPGIRVAYASSPYGPWTIYADGNGRPIDILANGSTYDALHIEWHQIYKVNGTYVMVYECWGNDGIYRIALASSSSPLGPWTKASQNPILSPSTVSGAFDDLWVATGSIATLNSTPYLIYCGCSTTTGGSGGFWSLALAKFPVASSGPILTSLFGTLRGNFR